MTDIDLSNLPDVESVREWARAIVTARGDAFVNWLYKDGLYIATEPMGICPMVVRENVGNPMQGGTNIARRIEVTTYPLADFAEPFWDQPERAWADIPTGIGGRRYNEITLPVPLTAPTLVRKQHPGFGLNLHA